MLKNIKISILFAITMLFGINLSAQEKKIEVGVATGYGYTMPKLKGSNVNDNLPGFHAGISLRFGIDDRFSIESGLLYNYFSGINISTNMLKLKEATGTWSQARTIASSVDLPIRVTMKAPLAEDLYFFALAGPNLNYGLSRIQAAENYANKALISEKREPNMYESNDYNKLDLQIGIGLGLQWRGLFLRGTYDWGLLDRNITDDITLRNNDLKVTLGYYF